MTKRNPYLWPKGAELAFYMGRGKCLGHSRDRKLDLSASLMLFCEKASRTIYLGFTIHNNEWPWWNEQTLGDIERIVRYDISYDGDQVSIIRITSLSNNEKLPCTNEFLWKLIIRKHPENLLGVYTMNDQEKPKVTKTTKPIRFTQARSDASISRIQDTIERKLGLPSGSVKLVYPSGRKARIDSTVGALRLHWERHG